MAFLPPQVPRVVLVSAALVVDAAVFDVAESVAVVAAYSAILLPKA